jgi:hypothetical protein
MRRAREYRQRSKVGSVVIGGGVCKLGRDDLRKLETKRKLFRGRDAAHRPAAPASGPPSRTRTRTEFRRAIIDYPTQPASGSVTCGIDNPQNFWALASIGIPLQDCSLPEAGGGSRDRLGIGRSAILLLASGGVVVLAAWAR